MRRSILFVHAISGCDTTSGLYKKGKISAFKTLQKDPHLQVEIAIFFNLNADKSEIIKSGEKFLISLYGPHKQAKNLNELTNTKINEFTNTKV